MSSQLKRPKSVVPITVGPPTKAPPSDSKFTGRHIILQAECSITSTSAKTQLISAADRIDITSKDNFVNLSGDKVEKVQGKYIIHTPVLELDGRLVTKYLNMGTVMIQNRIGGDTVSSGWLSVPNDVLAIQGDAGASVDGDYQIKIEQAALFNIQAHVSFYSTDSRAFAIARISINGERAFSGNGVFGNGVSHILASQVLSPGDIIRLEYFSNTTTKHGLGRTPPEGIDCVFSSLMMTKII